VKANKFENLVDYYSYLDSKSIIDPNEQMNKSSPEYLRIVEFVSKESLHTDMSLFSNHHLEDKIIKEYQQYFSGNNKVPLIYDK